MDPRRAGKCSVVDDGNAFRRHALSEPIGEGRGLLAIEIAFEAVADGFVQKDPGPAGTQHDVHGSSRARARVEVDRSDTNGFVHQLFPGFRLKKTIEFVPTAHRLVSDFPAFTAGILQDDLAVESHQGQLVADHRPVATGDQDSSVLGRGAGDDLDDPRVLGTSVTVDFFEQLDLQGSFRRRWAIGRRGTGRGSLPRESGRRPDPDRAQCRRWCEPSARRASGYRR